MTPPAVRAPAVAGLFYPADAPALAAEVDAHLGRAVDHGLDPKALVAPHAGYRYSAPVAASAYRGLTRAAGRVRRVVLVGPAHRVPLDGLAVPAASEFATPLGLVPVDDAGRNALAGLPSVAVDDEPHEPEHSLEVHLPFLQRVLGEFTVLPLCVGRAGEEAVADVLERVWGGPETLVVVSTDLSHYLDYDRARERDAETVAAVEALRHEDVPADGACGGRALGGLLLAARRRAMRVHTLDVRNSGDTEGDRDRVVGYGTWALVDDHVDELDAETGASLVRLARSAIEARLASGTVTQASGVGLDRRRAAFVTLTRNGELRGCIGGVEATEPVAVAVAKAATGAAFADPRFDPLGAEELADLGVSVSVLGPLERRLAASRDELVDLVERERPGLVLGDSHGARGVFLPQVWEQVPTAGEFVERLEEKAGMPGGSWRAADTAHTFRVQTFS